MDENVLSGLAILISLYALYQTHNQNKNNQGQIELMIEQNISYSKARLADLLRINKKSENDKQAIEIAIEEYLNAYESACSKYLDKKVDKKRFKKQYYKCIKDIVEASFFSKKLDKISSPYKAILKVYDEWYNLEK